MASSCRCGSFQPGLLRPAQELATTAAETVKLGRGLPAQLFIKRSPVSFREVASRLSTAPPIPLRVEIMRGDDWMSAVSEHRFALLGKGSQAFAPVLGSECGIEQAPLDVDPFGEMGFIGGVYRLFRQHDDGA